MAVRRTAPRDHDCAVVVESPMPWLLEFVDPDSSITGFDLPCNRPDDGEMPPSTVGCPSAEFRPILPTLPVSKVSVVKCRRC